MYIINTIPHGKCFVRCLRTRCFCIRNLTRSLRSLVRFLIRQQLMRKYRTTALSMKYSLYIYPINLFKKILMKYSGLLEGKIYFIFESTFYSVQNQVYLTFCARVNTSGDIFFFSKNCVVKFAVFTPVRNDLKRPRINLTLDMVGQPSRSSSLLFQLDLAHKEYWQHFFLAHGCDDSILASATLLCNLDVRRSQIFPFAATI